MPDAHRGANDRLDATLFGAAERILMTKCLQAPRTGKGQRLGKPLTCCFLGGDDGARTHDPRLAKPMLSQLSYVPVRRVF